MNVRGFFKNVLNNEGKEGLEPTDNPETTTSSTQGSGMSSFLSGTSRFLDTVQTKKNGLISDISNKLSSIKLPTDQPGEASGRRTDREKKKNRNTGDADEDDVGDSSASEYGDEGDRPLYTEEAPTKRRVSVDSVDSLPEDEATQWRNNISSAVHELLKQKSITEQMRNNLANYATRHTGRSAFAKELRSQVGSEKSVSMPVLNELAQLIGPILYHCNENDDFAPATHLMQLSFTLYQETKASNMNERNELRYLYTLLRDQPIWQSMRFWNAAFFITLQRKRGQQTVPAGVEGEEALRIERELHDDITYMELSKFIWRMFALGINKESCMEFLRKQANTANLSKAKSRTLLTNLQNFYTSVEPMQ